MGKRATDGAVIEGKYRLERELGAGGMGSVWLATQLMVDRPVAVKLLHPAFVDQAELQARFEVEAKAIGRLNHPNVITLYDFGFSEDLQAFYTVIEYIDGVSLEKRLTERMPLREILTIVRQIALALDHAHHHGILHRDLKPENVMLARMTDGSEMIKVLDFGIARIVKSTSDVPEAESQRITKAGEVFGTPAYMSPEQARSIRQLEPSADLYSLGVMFYELTTGSLPFFAHSAFDLLMLHVTKPVPPIRRQDVPDDFAAIIYRLLEKEPEKRFQSGKELARALDKLDVPEEEINLDDLGAEPTVVQALPTSTLGVASVAGLGDEGTDAEPDAFGLPTPAAGPLSPADQRRNTMMLHGSNPSETTLDTIPPPPSSRLSATVVLVVLLVVAGTVAISMSFREPDPTLRTEVDVAPVVAEEDNTTVEDKVVAKAGTDVLGTSAEPKVRPAIVGEAEPRVETPTVVEVPVEGATDVEQPVEPVEQPAIGPAFDGLDAELPPVKKKKRKKKRRKRRRKKPVKPKPKTAIDTKLEL